LTLAGVECPAAFTGQFALWKECLVPIEWEARWAPEVVWLLCRREELLLMKLMLLIIKNLTAIIIRFNF
jgi:hypothetical protein